ncbi:superoxide dismutase family protein [Sphingomonas sp. ID0503]|uniref:superoxide dismutase family protein n=1 Tax=Sphingomonas sp. ID0503 TaxID=3399691 RepID=UPI003AFAC548
MRIKIAAVAAVSVLALAGCMTDGTKKPAAGKVAHAALSNASGEIKGRASIQETRDGLVVRLNAEGMEPGIYAFHIHTTGKCDAPKFETAGGHWNPTMKQHGKDNPAGQHMGDMPNLEVKGDGAGELVYTVPGGKLASGPMPLFDADGAALMIHEKADDYRTDPTGAAGGRMACGVVMPG